MMNIVALVYWLLYWRLG